MTICMMCELGSPVHFISTIVKLWIHRDRDYIKQAEYIIYNLINSDWSRREVTASKLNFVCTPHIECLEGTCI